MSICKVYGGTKNFSSVDHLYVTYIVEILGCCVLFELFLCANTGVLQEKYELA